MELRGGGIHSTDFYSVISIENLLVAWKEFSKGKHSKPDVSKFEIDLENNLFPLHDLLIAGEWKPDPYKLFFKCDPKLRKIHKASVRDRLLHHAIYRVLYPYFDRLFIFDSYSCRNFKGTHRAINRFRDFGRKVSKNNTKTCWVLKCDIRKCFASVDQKILLDILDKFILDRDITDLLLKVIESFSSTEEGKGLPLGNLTSQLLINIYMNELDQFMKHKIKVKYYIRYADDFVILSQDRDYLLELIYKIAYFLDGQLKLQLHPNKVFIKTVASGVYFLGWVHFSNHRVLRTSTRHRVLKAFLESENINKLRLYSGLLGHGNQFLFKSEIDKKIEILKIKI